MDNHELTRLENNLRIITVPMNHVQSVTVMILVGAGSRYENKRISGLSHFLEHMAFKGTKKRPTALDISSEIEGIGGEFNAFTSKDQTVFYIKAAKKHLPILVDVLSDMLANSKFDPSEIERERGVIVEEINLYEDTPSRKIGEIYEELLYGDTPLGWDIAGKKETVGKIKRDDFLEYIKGLYVPKNSVVVVAGGVGSQGGKQKEVRKLIRNYLGTWQGEKTWVFEKASSKQNKPQAKIVYKKTEQAHLALGVRAYNLFHPDRFALAVLSTILGGGMSSRLFIQVRERRGLAYYIHSGLEHYVDVGHFVTRAGVDLDKVDEAIRIILEEYQKASKVSRGELKRAKEFLKGRFILDLEDSRSVASLSGSSELLEGKVRTAEEIIGEIDKVTIDDLERVAADLFKPKKLNLAAIGPFKDGQKFEKLLGL